MEQDLVWHKLNKIVKEQKTVNEPLQKSYINLTVTRTD